MITLNSISSKCLVNKSFAEARKRHKIEILNQNKITDNNSYLNQFESFSNRFDSLRRPRKLSEIKDYETMLEKWNEFKNQDYNKKKIIHIDLHSKKMENYTSRESLNKNRKDSFSSLTNNYTKNNNQNMKLENMIYKNIQALTNPKNCNQQKQNQNRLTNNPRITKHQSSNFSPKNSNLTFSLSKVNSNLNNNFQQNEISKSSSKKINNIINSTSINRSNHIINQGSTSYFYEPTNKTKSKPRLHSKEILKKQGKTLTSQINLIRNTNSQNVTNNISNPHNRFKKEKSDYNLNYSCLKSAPINIKQNLNDKTLFLQTGNKNNCTQYKVVFPNSRYSNKRDLSSQKSEANEINYFLESPYKWMTTKEKIIKNAIEKAKEELKGKVTNKAIEEGCNQFVKKISLFFKSSLKIGDLNEKLKTIIEKSNRQIIRDKISPRSKSKTQFFLIPF